VRGLGCSLYFFSLFLIFSYVFFVLSTTKTQWKNIMDKCRHMILMVISFIMAIYRVIVQVVSLR
jgi:hypothetical protein